MAPLRNVHWRRNLAVAVLPHGSALCCNAAMSAEIVQSATLSCSWSRSASGCVEARHLGPALRMMHGGAHKPSALYRCTRSACSSKMRPLILQWCPKKARVKCKMHLDQRPTGSLSGGTCLAATCSTSPQSEFAVGTSLERIASKYSITFRRRSRPCRQDGTLTTLLGQHQAARLTPPAIMAQQMASRSAGISSDCRRCSMARQCLRGVPLVRQQAVRQPFRGSRQQSVLVRAQAGQRSCSCSLACHCCMPCIGRRSYTM